MNTKIQSIFSGAAMAVAVASMAASAGTSDAPSVEAAGSSDLVHCYGANVCKGHNDCKTADNACGGHASCKGTGFVAMPSKACGDVGGAGQPRRQSVLSARLR